VERAEATEISRWSSIHRGHRPPTNLTSRLIELNDNHISSGGTVAHAIATLHGTDVLCAQGGKETPECGCPLEVVEGRGATGEGREDQESSGGTLRGGYLRGATGRRTSTEECGIDEDAELLKKGRVTGASVMGGNGVGDVERYGA
jgi:hypothetical protein